MQIDIRGFWLVALGLVACGNPVWAEEPEHDHEGIHCLSLTRIKSSEVLDRRHILFRMSGGKAYVNKLPRKCGGLSRHKPFMYRTSLNQLCDLDIITVLNDSGFGFTPGASCGLGLFYPINDEGIEHLKKRIEAGLTE